MKTTDQYHACVTENSKLNATFLEVLPSGVHMNSKQGSENRLLTRVDIAILYVSNVVIITCKLSTRCMVGPTIM